jgi:hypothetical protein
MASDIVGAVGDRAISKKAPRTAVWYSIIRTTFFVPRGALILSNINASLPERICRGAPPRHREGLLFLGQAVGR